MSSMTLPLFLVGDISSKTKTTSFGVDKLSAYIKEHGVILPESLKCLSFAGVQNVCISGKYMAFHLKDGRIARVSYTVRPDALVDSEEKVDPLDSCGQGPGISSVTTNIGPPPTNRPSNDESDETAPILNLNSPRLAGNPFLSAKTVRSLNFLREMQRSGIYLARSSSRQVAASDVPEHLIEQAMAVLQGKSREVIVRELQRTNLDVNMAVNNLLSREEESEEGLVGSFATISNPVPRVDLDELDDDVEDAIFSLFDNDSFLPQEDYIYPRHRKRVTAASGGSTAGVHPNRLLCAIQNQRRKRRGMDSDEAPPPYNARNKPESSKEGHSSDGVGSEGFPLEFGDELEFWSDLQQPHHPHLFFSHMGCLYSELVAVRKDTGELCQWRWDSAMPFFLCSMDSMESGINMRTYHHPRAADLDLCAASSEAGMEGERVVQLATSRLRATVLTNRGRLATWIDEKIASVVGNKLEHAATTFPDSNLSQESVVQLSVSSLVTCVLCESGRIYYWGVVPLNLRNTKKSLPAADSPEVRGGSHLLKTDSASTANLLPGMFVCMKNAPLYHSGAIGFTLKDGVPKLGTLQEDAWHYSDVCRFRVKSCDQLLSERRQVSCPPGSLSAMHALFDPALHTQVCAAYQLALYQQQQQNSANSTVPVIASTSTVNSNTGLMYSLMVNRETASSELPSRGPSSTYAGSDIGDLAVNSTGNRTEMMPPPPSPASSTCSDHSGHYKRKKASSSGNVHRSTSVDRDPPQNQPQLASQQSQSRQSNTSHLPPPYYSVAASNSHTVEEDWCLSDVVFLEDGRSQPVGFVLKVDSGFAAVKFLKEAERACLLVGCPMAPPIGMQFMQRLAETDSGYYHVPPPAAHAMPTRISTASDNLEWIQDIRLICKDDLLVVRNAASVRSLDFLQEKPTCVSCFPGHSICSVSNCNDFVYLVTRSHVTNAGDISSWAMHTMSMDGKVVRSHAFPTSMVSLGVPGGRHFLRMKALEPLNKFYHSSNGSASETPPLPDYLWDGNQCLYPYTAPTNSKERIAAPPSIEVPPVSALETFAVRVNRTACRHTSSSSGSTSAAAAAARRGAATGSGGNVDGMAPSSGSLSTSCTLRITMVAVDWPLLMHHVLRSDARQVQGFLRQFRRQLEIEQALLTLEQAQAVKKMLLSERLDGNRNLLHAVVAMCAPTSNQEAEWTSAILEELQTPQSSMAGSSKSRSSTDTRGEDFVLHPYERVPFTQNEAKPCVTLSSAFHLRALFNTGAPHNAYQDSLLGAYSWILPAVTHSPREKRLQAHRLLRCLFDQDHCIFNKADLLTLLQHRDDLGQTPFQLAVSLKAYAAAQHLLKVIFAIHEMYQPTWDRQNGVLCCRSPDALKSPASTMVMPESASCDDSPLVRLCYNDPCTFVWTGKNHIAQDIFECRTCGLTDTLCCCWECARSCHRGHDCRLKRRASPNAYCDCWQNTSSPCGCLIQGDKTLRLALFETMLKRTDLVMIPNGRGEHILLYLIVTRERLERESRPIMRRRRIGDVGGCGNVLFRRQMLEATASSSSSGLRVSGSGGGGGGGSSSSSKTRASTPEHNFLPPTFARDAIDICLRSVVAVESMLMWGVPYYQPPWVPHNVKTAMHFTCKGSLRDVPADQVTLNYQVGSYDLDRFVYSLVTKLSEPEKCLEAFLQTIRTLPKSRTINKSVSEHLNCINRLIRSVIRVYVSIAFMEKTDSRRDAQNEPKIRIRRLLDSRVPVQEPLRLCTLILSACRKHSVKLLAQEISRLSAPLRMGLLRSSPEFAAPATLTSSTEKTGDSETTSLLDELFFEPLAMNFNDEAALRWNIANPVRSSTLLPFSGDVAASHDEEAGGSHDEEGKEEGNTSMNATFEEDDSDEETNSDRGGGESSIFRMHITRQPSSSGTAAAPHPHMATSSFSRAGEYEPQQMANNVYWEDMSTRMTRTTSRSQDLHQAASTSSNVDAPWRISRRTATENANSAEGQEETTIVNPRSSEPSTAVTPFSPLYRPSQSFSRSRPSPNSGTSGGGGGSGSAETELQHWRRFRLSRRYRPTTFSSDTSSNSGSHTEEESESSNTTLRQREETAEPLLVTGSASRSESGRLAGTGVSVTATAGDSAATSRAGATEGGATSGVEDSLELIDYEEDDTLDDYNEDEEDDEIVDATEDEEEDDEEEDDEEDAATDDATDRHGAGGNSTSRARRRAGATSRNAGGEAAARDNDENSSVNSDMEITEVRAGGVDESHGANPTASPLYDRHLLWGAESRPSALRNVDISSKKDANARSSKPNTSLLDVATWLLQRYATLAEDRSSNKTGPMETGSSQTRIATESVNNSQVFLAKSVAHLLRLLMDLLYGVDESRSPSAPYQPSLRLLDACGKRMTSMWTWMCSLMDSLESQLRFTVAKLRRVMKTEGVDSHRAALLLKQRFTSLSAATSRWASGHMFESLSHVLSIMRANADEHADAIPINDVANYEFLAHLCDAMLCLVRMTESYAQTSAMKNAATSRSEQIGDSYQVANMPSEVETCRFFRRSDSTLSLNSVPVDVVHTPMPHSLPLATRPHLLQTHSRRSELFGSCEAFGEDFSLVWLQRKPSATQPLHLGLNSQWSVNCALARPQPNGLAFDHEEKPIVDASTFLGSVTSTGLILRWHNTLRVFHHYFGLAMSGSGTGSGNGERGVRSSLLEIGGFPSKQARFNAEMEMLSVNAKHDFTFQAVRGHSFLILLTCQELNFLYSTRVKERQDERNAQASRQESRGAASSSSNTAPSEASYLPFLMNQLGARIAFTTTATCLSSTASSNSVNGESLPPLCCSRMKITFHNESGEGNGVMRGFFTAFAQAVLSDDLLPDLREIMTFEHESESKRARMSSSLSYSSYGGGGILPGRSRRSQPATSGPPSYRFALHPFYARPDAAATGGSSSTSAYAFVNTSTAHPSPPRGMGGRFVSPLGRNSGAQCPSPAGMRAILHRCLTSDQLSGSVQEVITTNSPLYAAVVRAAGEQYELAQQTFHLLMQLPPPYSLHSLTNTAHWDQWIRAAFDVVNNMNAQNSNANNTNSEGAGGGGSSSAPRRLELPAILNSIRLRHTHSSRPVSSHPGSSSSTAFVSLTPLDVVAGLSLSSPSSGTTEGVGSGAPSGAGISVSAAASTASNVTVLDHMLSSLNPLYMSSGPSSAPPPPAVVVEDTDAFSPQPLQAGSGAPRLMEMYHSLLADSSDMPVDISGELQNAMESSVAAASTSSSLSPERTPLFWQPGVTGYYSPRMPVGPADPELMKRRYNVYRNVGRLMGMGLLMGQLIPLPLIRPVLKFILGRTLRWHDLAFFNHTVYESLRQLLATADTAEGGRIIESCELTFSYTACQQEGGDPSQVGSNVVELCPGGASLPVTAQNLRHYVHLYAKARMQEMIVGPLQNLRQGVLDVIPGYTLEGLTAEDLRLLLNGQGEVDVDQLMLYTVFVDETGSRPSKPEELAKIKKWFWRVVRDMTQAQRQDLVYFWTSSPSLPHSGSAFSPPPSILIRPADDNRLPSANTCVYRIYLPCYSSKKILRERLLQAIRVKDFGFV